MAREVDLLASVKRSALLVKILFPRPAKLWDKRLRSLCYFIPVRGSAGPEIRKQSQQGGRALNISFF